MSQSPSARKNVEHLRPVREMKAVLHNKNPRTLSRTRGLSKETWRALKTGCNCQLQTFVRAADLLGYEVRLVVKGGVSRL